MIVKKRIDNNRIFLTICDKELLGKKFSEKNKILDLSSSFYDGEEISKDSIPKTIKNSYFMMCVGKKSTSLLLKLKYIQKDSIKKISDIPYSMVIRES